MGLSGAEASQRRLIQHVLGKSLGVFSAGYLDDDLIFSNSPEENLNHTREVFGLLKEAGLKLRLKKCVFMESSLTFLGHLIAPGGILPDPKNVEKIVNLKPPTSIAEIRTLIGMTSFFRSFIKGYSEIVFPLQRKLTGENAQKKFTWGEAEQTAFETLQRCLSSPPIKGYPDFNLPFRVSAEQAHMPWEPFSLKFKMEKRSFYLIFQSS